MKYYDFIMSLGQYCVTSTALRRCHLQDVSCVFDWSAGILPEKCGKAGLEGKVDLICNDFQNFFEKEDFENRGNNQENDTYNLFIVNKRTGLQYKHDFPANIGFDKNFAAVKEKYMRRIERFYHTMSESTKVLFVFICKDEGLTNNYLIAQQEKLARKFPNKIIDLLYITQKSDMPSDKLVEYQLTPHVKRCECNVNHPTIQQYPESWNGNTALYYPFLENNYTSLATIGWMKNVISGINEGVNQIKTSFTNTRNVISEINESINYLKTNFENTKNVISDINNNMCNLKNVLSDELSLKNNELIELKVENALLNREMSRYSRRSFFTILNENRILLLSHITCGKMRKHYKNKWAKLKNQKKNI